MVRPPASLCRGKEDEPLEHVKTNQEAVSPVIATILMVAITVVLSGVLYVWASELAGGLPDAHPMNQLRASVASSDISNAANDTLLRLDRQTADKELRWGLTVLQINVGDMVYTCTVAGDDCRIMQTGDDNNTWEDDEVAFLVESGVDISGPGPTTEVWIGLAYNGVQIAGSGPLPTIQSL